MSRRALWALNAGSNRSSWGPRRTTEDCALAMRTEAVAAAVAPGGSAATRVSPETVRVDEPGTSSGTELFNTAAGGSPFDSVAPPALG